MSKKRPAKKTAKKKVVKKKVTRKTAKKKTTRKPAGKKTVKKAIRKKAKQSAEPKPAPRLVTDRNAGLLLILSGPSGAGKSTLARRLSAADSRIWRSVSMTTREPRPGEMIGIDYLFVSGDEFQRAIDDDTLLEYAHVHGGYYGTPKGPVVDRLTQGRDVLLEIDVQGAMQVKSIASEAILIFVATPTRSVLERRLRDRQSESEDRLQERLAAADKEVSMAKHYDYYVTNDDLDKASSDVLSIIAAERNRVQRRQEIVW